MTICGTSHVTSVDAPEDPEVKPFSLSDPSLIQGTDCSSRSGCAVKVKMTTGRRYRRCTATS